MKQSKRVIYNYFNELKIQNKYIWLAIFGLAISTAWANNFNTKCSNQQFLPVINRITKMNHCWNRGDVNCVVHKFYANNFTYVGNKIITTKSELIKHYQKSFQIKRSLSLGHLKLDFISCHYFGPSDISTLQKYTLISKRGVDQGYDILIWKKENTHFYIIMDFPKEIKEKT